ncbi:MAG TPA: hypothetical protein PLC42_04820, partial [Parachlamydiaceae bacterium]|nr:hypothetical protein [Parachlamydiaceae bacterium]
MSARDLNQLEDLAEKKHPAVETAIKCKAFFMKSLIVLDLNISKKDIDEINRTQEHLFTSYGSFEKDQIRELKKLIGEKKGFQQLKKELNSYKPAESLRLKILTAPLASLMVSCPTDSGRKTLTKKYIKAVADNRAHSMQIAVKKLSKGESVLIDGHVLRFKGPAMKPSGGHAMVMRITRNHNNTYNMEFVNTGIGITRNSEFHPKSKTVENEYQTVALIQNISPKKLFKNHFFETFSSVASGGKIPTFSCIPKEQLGHAKGLATQGENSNLENQIDLMYLCMRQLGKPVQMEEGSSYYTQAQLGGSCSVSSLWAVSQIVLSKEEVKILKTDAKLKSLIRNYKKIQNGYDQSSTRKLMVLDQVQSLKQHYMHDQNAQKILNKTELDLLSDLKINRVEIKTSSKGKVSLKQFLEPIKGKPGEFTLKPMQATLNFQTKRLKVDVDWEPVNGKDSFATSISY